MHKRPYQPGDEHGIAALFQECFGWERSIEEWRWRYQEGPCEQVLIEVLDADGDIVGHMSHVGFPTWLNGVRALARQTADWMVAGAWRRHGGFAALRGGLDESPWECTLYFPSEYTARQSVKYGLKRFQGRLTQWVRAHDGPGRLFALAADAVRPRLTVGHYEPDVAADALAARSASFAPGIRIRDARYLRWRWLEQPRSDWRIMAVRRGDELRGVAAYGVDSRRDAVDVGRVVDLLAVDSRTTTALLVASARALRAHGCRRVVFDYHDPRPWARRACYRAGFAPRGQGLFVTGAATSDMARPVADDLANWYLTRGDSDLC